MRTNVTVSLFVGVVSLCGFAFAGDEAAQGPSRRVAFAISGGASKGAYEAGLNWAIVRVFTQAEEFNAVLGARYRTFEPAAFAGASAGGINTLLGGLSWCMLPEAEGGPANRIDDNIFRDVWLLPDVNSLLPPEPDSPHYLPDDALLARSDFLGAAQKLRDLWNRPAFRPGCRVPLGVTLTRNEAEVLQIGSVQVGNQRFYSPFVLEVQPAGDVEFVFDPGEYPTLSDPAMILVPRTADQAVFRIADDDVIDLALITSAFPGAFGRRWLEYCRSEGFVPEGGPRPVVGEAPALICPEGYVLSKGVFSDGGLFDNLPIGLARKLAEQHANVRSNPLPVSYFYLDPNGVRYDEPEPVDPRACDLPNPPEACKLLAYNLSSETGMLFGALGTARTFELYRELTSGAWSVNLSGLAAELGEAVEALDPQPGCSDLLPYFDRELPCTTALRRAGELLSLAYRGFEVPITPPFSAERLRAGGLASRCGASADTEVGVGRACALDPAAYRRSLADALVKVVERTGLEDDDQLGRQIRESAFSMHNDRELHITSRGAPITGTLMGSFGAFLDYEFRDYDYYVGVYDAVVLFSEGLCASHFSAKSQSPDYGRCFDEFAEAAYDGLGIDSSPRARFMFALLARRNLEARGLARFAYDQIPEEDRSMAIIAEGLERTLESGRRPADATDTASVEEEFFTTLRDEGFVPTPTADGSEPLLAQTMENPQYWSATLIKRATNRLVYLEQQAEALYEAQEPDPARRQQASPTLMGAAAFALQSATYTNPGFTFAPSTAPAEWGWRNVIPYEVAFDFGGNDLVLTWQPTVALDRRTNLGLRTGFGIARGVVAADDSKADDSYFTLGLDLTRLTESAGLSSWGLTPAYFHTFDEEGVERQDSFGFDVHAGFLKNRFRIGAGARDVNDFGDTWFVLFGIADVPGAIYWLTR